MHKLIKTATAIAFFVLLAGVAWSEGGEIPQNYMAEKHGVSDPFYCDLDDPVEEIACTAWDSALGGIQFLKSQSKGGRELSIQEFKILASISAANIIQQNIFGLINFLYLKKDFGGYDQSICLLQHRGSCGNQQLLFEDVLKFLGVKSRSVGVYMEREDKRLSHAMTEVQIYDKWILIDITNGSVYQKNDQLNSLISFAELRKLTFEERKNIRRSNQNDIVFRTFFLAGMINEKLEGENLLI